MADSVNKRQRNNSVAARTMDLRQNLFRIPDNISVALGLRWDFIGAEPVDLDASCVSFDDEGNCLDVVFFNHLKTEPPVYMEHSGDNQTGENDAGQQDDETICLHMNLIPSNVAYLMVCVTSYTGADFTLVERASCRLVNLATRESVGEFQLGIVGRHTATLLCSFSRVPNAESAPLAAAQPNWWDLREINFPCAGSTFCDVLPKMLDFLAVPEDQREVRLANLPDYSLSKEGEKNVTLSQIKMGLGWDGENDLDAALIFLDGQGRYYDHVYAKYGRLKSRDGSALHSGDKLNGYDVAGDDEFIDIDLNRVEKAAEFIFFVGTLFDGFAKSMGSVPNAYVRIVNRSSPLDKHTTELHRVSITKQGGDATAMVFCYCHRVDTAHWEFVKTEEHSQGRDYVDVFPLVRSLAHFHQRQSDWPAFRERGMTDVGVQVIVLEARNLGPLEPHQFACHVRGWVQDRKAKAVKSGICHDRNDVRWPLGDHKFGFIVNRMDIIRIVLYEHAMIGLVDLSVEQVTDALMGDMTSPLSSKVKQSNHSETEPLLCSSPAAPDNANGDPLPPAAVNTSPVVSHAVLDDWWPLSGKGITGEVRLLIQQRPVKDILEEEAQSRRQAGSASAKGSWWCVVS